MRTSSSDCLSPALWREVVIGLRDGPARPGRTEPESIVSPAPFVGNKARLANHITKYKHSEEAIYSESRLINLGGSGKQISAEPL